MHARSIAKRMQARARESKRESKRDSKRDEPSAYVLARLHESLDDRVRRVAAVGKVEVGVVEACARASAGVAAARTSVERGA
jgi:hypothetical protein